MKIKAEFKTRKIAGETIIIMQGTHGADMTKVLALNSTAEWLWENLKGKEFSVSDVVTLLQSHYNVDQATAERDSNAWIDNLKKFGIISNS